MDIRGARGRLLRRLRAWIGWPHVSVVVACRCSGRVGSSRPIGRRRLLAPRAATAKLTTYESGVDPVGEGWAQTQVRYFVYAFLYVIFAVDAVYLFPWATVCATPASARRPWSRWPSSSASCVVGLVHAARRGLLRWL